MKAKSNYIGVCPVCDEAGTLKYDKAVFDDYGLYFPWICKNCNSTGNEEYAMQFCGHSEIYNDEGEEVEDYGENN